MLSRRASVAVSSPHQNSRVDLRDVTHHARHEIFMTSTDAIADTLMREADTLLQGLFSNALIGVYVIQDDRFVFVNQRLADVFGYSQEE